MPYVGRFFNASEEDQKLTKTLENEPVKVYFDLYDQKYVCHKIKHTERVTLSKNALDFVYSDSVEEFDKDKPRYYKYDRKNRDERFEGIKNILKQNLEKQKELYKELNDVTEQSLDEYVDRKKKDSINAEHARMKRYIRKAGMNRKILNYFFTVTWDSSIYSDVESWMKALCTWCANNSYRYGVKIMGGFEFGEENSRLHFHAVAHIPEDFFGPNDLVQVSRYSEKEHKWRNVMESVELRKKFGINEFERLEYDDNKNFLNVLTYVACYACKDGGKMYYSRGLRENFETFINAEDIFFEFDDGIIKYRLCDAWAKYDRFGRFIRLGSIVPTDELPFEETA